MTSKFRARVLAILSAVPLASPASLGPHRPEVPQGPTASLQIIVVKAPTWKSLTGTLQCYERERPGADWKPVGDATPVDLGMRGLAWGRGLQGGAPERGPEKLEGDGKSPAGLFRLSAVFGYAPADSVRFVKMPYVHLNSTCQCVDDPNSFYYNLVIDSLSVARPDWESHEIMRQPDDSYKWGVMVDHNTIPRQGYDGSCIFLHVWAGPASPTSGCTALEESKLVSIIKWLDPAKNPVLVQLPDEQYARFREKWNLP